MSTWRDQPWGWRNVWGTPNTDLNANETNAGATYTRKCWYTFCQKQCLKSNTIYFFENAKSESDCKFALDLLFDQI